MIDTSAMVAALVSSHEHHVLARPHLTTNSRVPAIVLAETYAQLRRTFAQPAEAAAALLAPWATDSRRVLGTSAKVTARTFSRAVELDLAGNIHDALIAACCADAGVPLATLDRRQHAVALAFDAASTYLLA
ncbi:MAG: PIN domain-containing protein [Egibacteraceae bacterium]